MNAVCLVRYVHGMHDGMRDSMRGGMHNGMRERVCLVGDEVHLVCRLSALGVCVRCVWYMSEVRLVHEYSMSGWKMRCTCGMQVECAWCVREVCLVRVALKEYGALRPTGPKSSRQKIL